LACPSRRALIHLQGGRLLIGLPMGRVLAHRVPRLASSARPPPWPAPRMPAHQDLRRYRSLPEGGPGLSSTSNVLLAIGPSG